MQSDRVAAVEALLHGAEEAHATYEATELKGVYDQEWAGWYAEHVVEHGLGAVLGREVTADEVAQFLAGSYSEFEQSDPTPSEPWSAYTARRMTAEL